MRPLHVLVFLLPLLIAYEIGSVLYLVDAAAGVQRTVAAYGLFGDFFSAFGISGAFLPGIALVTVLVVWHIIAKDPWPVDRRTIGGMAIESVAWALPLLVFAAVNSHLRGSMGLASAITGGQLPVLAGTVGAAGMQDSLLALPAGARFTISVGAGLYEEMLFRLVGIAVLHWLLVDLIGLTQKWGASLAVLISALAFAVYHQPNLPEDWAIMIFMTLAGVYFGTIYLMRGFGIVVATHAIYDILVLVVLPALRG